MVLLSTAYTYHCAPLLDCREVSMSTCNILPLAKLAERINVEHRASKSAMRKAVGHALKVGDPRGDAGDCADGRRRCILRSMAGPFWTKNRNGSAMRFGFPVRGWKFDAPPAPGVW